MARVGTWKDGLRRCADAGVASFLPGGWRLTAILASVDGYLYPHEAVFLLNLAKDIPVDGAIVEIGSYRGRSTLCLARGASIRGGRRVISVDPHVYGTARELRENLERFGAAAWVEVMQLPSTEAATRWTGRASAIFVDGDHSERAARADVDAWLPHLVPGGIMALHDATEVGDFEGPRKVAETRLREGEEFDAVGRVGSIAWGRLRGAASNWKPRSYGRHSLDPVLRSIKRRRRAL